MDVPTTSIRRNLFLAAVAATLLPAAGAAHADSIMIMSDPENTTEGLGQFEGTIDYTHDGLIGSLVISLLNTTPEETGGYLTGVLFNIDGVGADALLVDAPNSTFEFASGNGAPYGSFESGAALGGKFLGGGSPVNGLEVAETGIFTFQVIGSSVPFLSASSFVAGVGEPGLLVRFKGMNGGSDKVGAVGATVVPLPAPLALGAVGLLGVAIRSRRRGRGRSSA